MSLPGPLAALDLGEPPLGHLRTAGQIPFLDATGEEKVASLWFVVCRTRCWLVAATQDHQWSVGDADVALEKGWTWDAIRVGPWTAPLRNGTRAQATALLKQWRLSDRSGSSVPPPVPERGSDRAPIAAGAHDVPEWIGSEVPADSEARWLFAYETDKELAFARNDGQLTRESVWFAVSDRSVVLAALGPEYPFVRPVEAKVALKKRTTARHLLMADGWALPGALVDRKSALAETLANAEPGAARWATAMLQAIDAGEIERAVGLAREAFVLDRHREAWSWIGLLLVDTHPADAVGAALQYLAAHPDAVLREAGLAWAHRRKDVRGAGPNVPAGLRAECTVPERPAGLPWPPSGPLEVWSIAGILDGRVAEGLALWGSKGDNPRVRQAIAATTSGPDAADAWFDAATQWRADDPEAARECLARAIEASSEPADLHWRAGAWAYEDGADATPHWDAALPAVPPDDLEQPLGAWRALAARAEETEAWDAAAHAWRQARTLDSTARSALVREAELCETRLGQVDGAIEALRLLAERTEGVVDPEPSRWWVWTEIARLLAIDEATDPGREGLRAALSEAVKGDFLVPEAYSRALQIGEGRLPDDELDWWRHVQAQLTGKPVGSPRPPVQTLTADALDGLHPGGVGWLEKTRQSLDSTDPPEISDLTRGLEKVQPGKWPKLAAAMSSLAEALAIEPPATYLFRGEGAWGLSAWPTEPPLILLGHDHLEEEHPLGMSREALAFALAVELVHLAAGHPLLAFDGGLVGTSRSVYQAFGKYAGTAETVVDVVTLLPGVDQISKIQTVIKLSKKVFTARSVVDKTTGYAETGWNLMGWNEEEATNVGRQFEGPALQFRLQADRAALLLTGDLEAAIEAVLRGHPDTAGTLEKTRKEGLLAVIEALDEDTAMRLASLLEFAAGL